MPYTPLAKLTRNVALLLIEPDPLRSLERVAQLEGLHFCVTRAESTRAISLLRQGFDFSIAVLSDGMNFPALQASAQRVRSQWPKAWIVLLGQAPSRLDDHLYDESIVPGPNGSLLSANGGPIGSNGNTLVEVANPVSVEDWDSRSHDAYAASLVRDGLASRSKQSRAALESDPRKVSVRSRDTGYAKDQPANERSRQGVR